MFSIHMTLKNAALYYNVNIYVKKFKYSKKSFNKTKTLVFKIYWIFHILIIYKEYCWKN